LPQPGATVRLEERVRARARELGFDAVGFARADVALDADFARYEAFVDGAMHGDMQYLAENRDVRARADNAGILEGARTVICLARRYDRPAEDEAKDAPLAKSIARYARGQDYHNTVRKKLRKLAAFVRTLRAGDGEDEVVQARPLCDDAPILERAWAARAGLGFVGKNGMLIVPGQGSFVLLGEVVTTLRLEPDSPVPDRCGACTLCLEACPTGAFVEPRVLDARKCISYLTIERRGPIPEPLRAPVGERLFGCDDCQTVCPWNAHGASKSARNGPAETRVFSPHPRWADTTTADLLALDEAAFAEVSRGSPLHRATRDGLARNAAVVCGNAKDESARGALEHAAAADGSEVVRDAARWALGRLGSKK
jgi:epoxyqueuosine reductase